MHPADPLGDLSFWEPGAMALIIFGCAVVGMIAVLLFLTRKIGEQKPSTEKLRPYESGIIPTGTARLLFPIPFFLMAIFFLIFDVEGAYIFTWAVACETLGWAGWIQISFFIFVLMLGLVYIWYKGGLDWGPNRNKR